MALPLARAAPLKPAIRLAQALSEFDAVLNDDQKTKLRTYRGQSPPNPTDIMRFTSEIDRDASRNRKSRQCVGTRLTNVLHSVQQFSTVVDLIVGSSQSQIAGAIWGTVKLSLQVDNPGMTKLVAVADSLLVGLRHFVLFRSIINFVHEDWAHLSRIPGFRTAISRLDKASERSM